MSDIKRPIETNYAPLSSIQTYLRDAEDIHSRSEVVHAVVLGYLSSPAPELPVRSWEFDRVYDFYAAFNCEITSVEFDRAIEYLYGEGYAWPLNP